MFSSLYFYTEVLGFTALYERPEERFVFLEREGAALRRLDRGDGFAPLLLNIPTDGVSTVSAVDSLYHRCCETAAPIIIPLEERWYRRDTTELGNRQFVVADPDGFLLRLFTNLGSRPVE